MIDVYKKQRELAEERQKEELKYLSALHEVFVKSPAGREILEEWQKQYIYAPNVPPQKDHKDYPDYYPYIREGENKFIRAILVGIKRYEAYINKPK